MEQAEIVLIEDNPGDVFLFRLALVQCGVSHRLTHFESGSEAERTLSTRSAEDLPPDVILVDLNLPDIGGLDVIGRLKLSPRLSHVPMAIMTSSRAYRDKELVASRGLQYIWKPSQLQEYLENVARAVKEMLPPARQGAV